MSVTYRAVGWNRQKRIYDGWMTAGIVAYLAIFGAGMAVAHPTATVETILIRASGTLALLLLHVILSIGPLCRIDSRFLPLLYNRRHLGVATSLMALVHGALSLVQFHALGDRNPLVSLLTTSTGWTSVADFPFQVLGLLPLGWLFLMAATSHDFWLHSLTPRVWKALHMGVYVAYASVVAHVAFGALQSERSGWLVASLVAGVFWVVGLHLVAAGRESRVDRVARVDPLAAEVPVPSPWRDVCGVADIPDGRARVVTLGGERIAIFRYDGKISAISNVCRHQNGPLGEGRIVRGCVVCPWHGYEYRPDSGAAPPPFSEKVETFSVEVRGDRVWLDPHPHPPGTRLEPAAIGQ